MKFKSVEKANPSNLEAPKKFYAQIVTEGETTMDNMVKDIEKFSALSEPNIRGIIIALENVIQNRLAEGRIVRMEKLGSFYPSISSSGGRCRRQGNRPQHPLGTRQLPPRQAHL